MYGPQSLLAGRYRLVERIAAGGMGEVWRGTDEVLGRTVAVKIMLPALLNEPGFQERFRGEARTMANLSHPGVVDVYDYHSDGTLAFLVMEYVEGEALSAVLQRVGRLPPARTMPLVAQAADALQAAHDKGIVHRDIKPGNLMVRPDGRLVLTDFGVARSALVGQITATGAVLGTAGYLSPEQADGRPATAASDIYALGVVAYQCLAGRRPFEGDNPIEVAMRHLREEPPPLPPDIPPPVRAVVSRALAKDPAQRWPSAAEFAAAARRAAGASAAASAGAGGVTAPATAAAAAAAAGGTPRAGGADRAGVASIPVQPAREVAPRRPATPPVPAAPVAPTPRFRPSAVDVAAMVLAVVAVLLCAGLAGYVARQLVHGASLADLFPFSSTGYVQETEGSTTT
ncbi:MAG TPA: serine/threonine-protein kinase [Natronosporangium sp.]|nr:serine/threonine-protein kinase [Natronosporangium sp.]